MPDISTNIDGSLEVTTVPMRDWRRVFIGILPMILLIALLHLALDVRLLLAIALSCFGMALFWIWMRRRSLGFHVQGMKQLHAGVYNAAIVDFEKSLSYFHSHPFLDRHRTVMLGSSSRLSFREMALVNIAACYLQLRDLERAREYYETARRENPHNHLAVSGLKLLSFLSSYGSPSPRTVSFTRDEALVLHHFLYRLTEELMAKRPDDSMPSAEELVLWKIEGMLDRALVEPFRENYVELLEAARLSVVKSRVEDTE